jgi:hypothetical protein
MSRTYSLHVATVSNAGLAISVAVALAKRSIAGVLTCRRTDLLADADEVSDHAVSWD